MSCLFIALQKLLNNKDMRKIICEYMEKNQNEKLGDDTIKNWIIGMCIIEKTKEKEYIEKMKKSSTWGGALEIAVASKIFDSIINVIKSGKIISTFNCGQGKKELNLIYTGSHYEPKF